MSAASTALSKVRIRTRSAPSASVFAYGAFWSKTRTGVVAVDCDREGHLLLAREADPCHADRVRIDLIDDRRVPACGHAVTSVTRDDGAERAGLIIEDDPWIVVIDGIEDDDARDRDAGRRRRGGRCRSR